MADWTRTQGISTQAGSSSGGLSFTSPIASGGYVFVDLLFTTGFFATAVTDDRGNLYTQLTAQDDLTTLRVETWVSLHPITNGAQLIKAAVSGTPTVFWQIQEEFQPPTGTLDASADGGGAILANSVLQTTPNFRTIQNDVLIRAVSLATNSAATGAGFTAGMGTGTQICTEWKIQATPSDANNGVFVMAAGQTWETVVAIAPVARTTWAVVQRNIQRTGAGLNASISLPNPIAPGNFMIGSIAIDHVLATVLTSLQDDKLNNMQLIAGTLGNVAGDRQIFWHGVQIYNGPKTVNAVFNTSEGIAFFLLAEVSPPPGTIAVAIDGTPVNITETNVETVTTTPNVTTTHPNDFAYSFGDVGGSGIQSGNSFSAINGENSTWEDAWQIWPTARVANVVWNHGSTSAGGNNASLVVLNAILGNSPILAARPGRFMM